MRGTRNLLFVIGLALIVGGAVLLVTGVRGGGATALGYNSAGGSLIVTGLIMIFAGRFAGRVLPTVGMPGNPSRSRDGTPTIQGTARVQSVRDTGVTINNTQMIVAAQSIIEAPGIAPFGGEVRIPLGRTQWGVIQPGMVLPVLIDPHDHSKVAFDKSRPVIPGAIAGSPIAGGMQATTRSSAEVIAMGVPTSGVLQSVVPTGMTAGQVSPQLPAHEADDPVVQITMQYAGPGGAPLSTTVMVRVPDGKAGLLASGATVPVRYLPNEPSVATIDWTATS
jgi:hypothetical protein